MDRQGQKSKGRRRVRWRAYVLPLALFTLVIAAAAYALVASIYRDHAEEAAQRLDTVVRWRAAQIHNWLGDRLSQARHTADGPVARLFGHWRADGSEFVHDRALLHLEVLREASGAEAAFIVGDDGAVVSDPARPPPERSYQAAVRRALATDEPQFTEPAAAAPGTLWLDFIAPLGTRDIERPAGAVVIRVNGADFFGPLLVRWPGPGSGRLSLVHNDGRVLAAGGADPGDGAVTRATEVEGTPWSLRAEMPAGQAYARAREQALWVWGFAALSVCLFAGLLHMRGQRRALQRQSAQVREQAHRLESLRLLQAVADSSMDIIYVKDLEGRYLLFNEQSCRMTGKRVDEVLGRDVGELYPAEAAQRYRLEDQEVLATGQSRTQDHEVQTPYGPRVLHSIKSPLRAEDGRIVGTFGISRDITERHQAERDLRRLTEELAAHRDHLEELVEARTAELACTNRALQSAVDELQAFSYTLSHDLRAPLQVIAGFGRALAEGEASRLSDTGRHRLERIQAAALRMDCMIDDLLACSRAERKQLERKSVDLTTLAREACDEAAARYPETRVEIGQLPRVHADPVLLQQAFANLVGNAFKFSAKAPKPQVVVDSVRLPDAWQVRVRDNGAGFDPAYRDKLFQLFQRLHKDTEYTGTGVGLAIVKRVVARHGGQVAADCVPGQWTTFSFTLPGA